MTKWLPYPSSVQIALCAAVWAWIGWRFGTFAMVITSPGLAAAVARPVLNLIANLRQGVRAHVWLPVHGQHYVYKGITIHVLEDDGARGRLSPVSSCGTPPGWCPSILGTPG